MHQTNVLQLPSGEYLAGSASTVSEVSSEIIPSDQQLETHSYESMLVGG